MSEPTSWSARTSIEQVRDAAEKIREGQHELEEGVRYARACGLSLRAIAEAAGLSHEQVRRLASRVTA